MLGRRSASCKNLRRRRFTRGDLSGAESCVAELSGLDILDLIIGGLTISAGSDQALPLARKLQRFLLQGMPKPVPVTVDDDPGVLRAIERDLRSHYSDKYRVMRASSGGAALSTLRELKARNNPVALLLADQRMPQMNGVGFLSEAMEIHPQAKRALLTAYADTTAAIDAINEARIHYYLMKPWDPPEEKLFPAIDDLLTDWNSTFRPLYEGIRVLGTRWSNRSYELRDFLARNQVPYQWIDVELAQTDPEVRSLIASLGPEAETLPAVLFPTALDLRSLHFPQLPTRLACAPTRSPISTISR